MYQDFFSQNPKQVCHLCHKTVKEGEAYAENNETIICAECTEELDLCDILEFLDVENVLSLLGCLPDTVKKMM